MKNTNLELALLKAKQQKEKAKQLEKEQQKKSKRTQRKTKGTTKKENTNNKNKKHEKEKVQLITIKIEKEDITILPLYISSLIFLYFSSDSPVIELSSKYKSPSTIIASAGILSPCSNIKISSTTTSSMLIIRLFVFLITFTSIELNSSFNFSKDFSLLYSEITEIIDAKNTDIAIPIVSYKSVLLNISTNFIESAINRILTIGSLNDSINKDKIVVFLWLDILLVPCFFCEIFISSFVNPFILFIQYLIVKYFFYDKIILLFLLV